MHAIIVLFWWGSNDTPISLPLNFPPLYLTHVSRNKL